LKLIWKQIEYSFFKNNQSMQRNYSLLMTAAIALSSNVCMAQTSPGEPYIELTSEQETGKWGLSLAVANDEDKAKVWVDLNNNGQKDENETIGMWEWYWYSRPRTAKTLRIYGPVIDIDCGSKDNAIAAINIKNNPNLQKLKCTYSKGLTSLDLSGNANLKKVNVSGCKLNSIALPVQSPAMEELDVNDNELDKLEVSGCSKLVRIDCFKNRLTADAMQKLVETLPDRSQENTAGRLFVLYSIDEKEKNEILKTSVEQAKTKKWDVKYFTGQLDYSGSDHNRYLTSKPKAILTTSKQSGEWLLNIGVPEQEVDSVWIDLNNNNEYDYGEEQNVFNQQVRLPISGEKINIYGKLSKLVCMGNHLTALNVEECTELETLNCSKNELQTLKLNSNKKLKELLGYENELTEIDLSENKELVLLSLNTNKLSAANFDNNNALTTLFISNNELKELNVKPCINLRTIAFENNQLQEVDLSKNALIESIYAQKNKLTKLNLKGLNGLRMLSCEHNALSSIALDENLKQLEAVYCFCNQIKGQEMKSLCNMLPVREDNKKGEFYVVDTTNPTEENQCTKKDVEVANKHNWQVYDYKNKENNGKNLYEGKENPTGLNLPEGREDINVCFIANGLLQINTPQSLQGRDIRVYDINGRILKQDVCKGGLQLLSIQKGDSQGVIFIQVDGKTFKRMH
jgi:immunoreactive 47 kDa antigen PG97